jgi:hypothetical protein
MPHLSSGSVVEFNENDFHIQPVHVRCSAISGLVPSWQAIFIHDLNSNRTMNQLLGIIILFLFVLVTGTLLSALFTKPFDPLALLAELANNNGTVVRQITLGRSIVEIHGPVGSMSVGVWPTSMLGTASMSCRANISIQPTKALKIPEFELYSRYSVFAGFVHGFKLAKSSKSPTDKKFEKQWCIFVRPEVSAQQIDILLQQLKIPLANLSREALSPQWNVVEISCQEQKINFIYSKPVYQMDTLEILMNASVKFAQATIHN